MGVLFAHVRPLVYGVQAHDAHQTARTVATRRKPGLGKIGYDLAAAKERVLRKYLVNLMHQFNLGLIKANRCVMDRGPVDLERLTLTRKAKVGGVLTDHCTAFTGAHRFSPCDRKSFSTASGPILA